VTIDHAILPVKVSTPDGLDSSYVVPFTKTITITNTPITLE
jgi:hypothetical protein